MRIRSNMFVWVIFFLLGISPTSVVIAQRVDSDVELLESLKTLEGMKVDGSPHSSYRHTYTNLEGRVLDSFDCNTALGPPITLEQIQVGLSGVFDFDDGNSTLVPIEVAKAIKNKVTNLQYGVQLWKVRIFIYINNALSLVQNSNSMGNFHRSVHLVCQKA